MKWFESKSHGGNKRIDTEPSEPAISISFGTINGKAERVRFRLSAGLIKAARLQRGDKLQAGISDEGGLCFRRHPSGNSICGVGFTSSQSEKNSGRPHVVFQDSTFPLVVAWALTQKKNAWIEVLDMGTHFEAL